jgi:HAMP domain-containing protein
MPESRNPNKKNSVMHDANLRLPTLGDSFGTHEADWAFSSLLEVMTETQKSLRARAHIFQGHHNFTAYELSMAAIQHIEGFDQFARMYYAAVHRLAAVQPAETGARAQAVNRLNQTWNQHLSALRTAALARDEATRFVSLVLEDALKRMGLDEEQGVRIVLPGTEAAFVASRPLYGATISALQVPTTELHTPWTWPLVYHQVAAALAASKADLLLHTPSVEGVEAIDLLRDAVLVMLFPESGPRLLEMALRGQSVAVAPLAARLRVMHALASAANTNTPPAEPAAAYWWQHRDQLLAPADSVGEVILSALRLAQANFYALLSKKRPLREAGMESLWEVFKQALAEIVEMPSEAVIHQGQLMSAQEQIETYVADNDLAGLLDMPFMVAS